MPKITHVDQTILLKKSNDSNLMLLKELITPTRSNYAPI